MSTKAACVADLDVDYFTEYRITESTVMDDDEIHTVYGIEVTKFDSRGMAVEQATASALTTNRFAANAFMETLRRGEVTPCTLLDLAEDCIC